MPVKYTDVATYLSEPRLLVKRCGVIPYMQYQGRRMFCLGIDQESGDVTNLSGQSNARKDKNSISAALREFREEALGIFSPIKVEDISDSLVIYNNAELIVFIHVDLDPNKTNDLFVQAHERELIRRDERMAAAIAQGNVSPCRWRRCSQMPEIAKLIWLDEDDMDYLLHGRESGRPAHPGEPIRMFDMLKDFLLECRNVEIEL